MRPTPSKCRLRSHVGNGIHLVECPRFKLKGEQRDDHAAKNMDGVDEHCDAPVDASSFPVITRDMVKYAKPDPDLFLAAARLLAELIRARAGEAAELK